MLLEQTEQKLVELRAAVGVRDKDIQEKTERLDAAGQEVARMKQEADKL